MSFGHLADQEGYFPLGVKGIGGMLAQTERVTFHLESKELVESWQLQKIFCVNTFA